MTTHLEKRADGWWITDPPPGVKEMGPYTTRGEADEDRIGLERFIRLTQGRTAPKE